MKLDMAKAPRVVSKHFGVGARGSQNQGKWRSSHTSENSFLPFTISRRQEQATGFPAERKQVAKLQTE